MSCQAGYRIVNHVNMPGMVSILPAWLAITRVRRSGAD